jgi:hypothetical protein
MKELDGSQQAETESEEPKQVLIKSPEEFLNDIKGQHESVPNPLFDSQPVEKDLGDKKKPLVKVGDVEIGGYNILAPGTQLEKGYVVGGGKETFLAVLAKSSGYTITEKDLAKMGIKGVKELPKIKDEVIKQAQGAEWHIDLVETKKGTEIRAFIGESERKEADDGKGKAEDDGENAEIEEYGVEWEEEPEYEADEGSEEEMKDEL